jgi:hypothetical protein
MATPFQSPGKSYVLTSVGFRLQARPPFLKGPMSSRFFASALMMGLNDVNYFCRRVASVRDATSLIFKIRTEADVKLVLASEHQAPGQFLSPVRESTLERAHLSVADDSGVLALQSFQHFFAVPIWLLIEPSA